MIWQAIISASRRFLCRRWLVITLVVVMLLTAAGLDYLYYRNRVFPGVAVGNIDLSGKTFEEAKKMLEEGYWTLDQVAMKGPSADEVLVFPLDELGLEWDREGVLNAVFEAGRGIGGYGKRISYLVKRMPLQVEPCLLVENRQMLKAISGLASQFYRAPQDAYFTVDGEIVEIHREVNGRYLKAMALRNKLLKSLLNRKTEIGLPLEEWPAARTAADLEKYGVQQLAVSFYSDVAAGNPNRLNNIRLGTEAINGVLLAPGEVFSFEAAVGEATREKGYLEAPVIVGEELVPGLGGGLCQVASTLYNAALLANLDIVERHNHSLAVAYLPLGRDAAVAYGYLDLKFKNSRGHFILIGGELDGYRLIFRIFGPPMEKEVVIETTDRQVIQSPPRYERTAKLPPGEMLLKSEGKPGYNVTTWRVVYQDGQEVEREFLSRDRYQPTPTVYLLGEE